MAKRNLATLIFSFSMIFFTFVLLLDMATSTAVCEMEERPSRLWQGQCFRETSCDRKCQHWENADYGTCHGLNPLNKKCVCYYKSESCGSESSTVGSSNTVTRSAFRMPTQRGFSTVGNYNGVTVAGMAGVGN